MELNADFSVGVLLHAPDLEWTPSPMEGVHRRMLDRIGDEVARATTIVRYAAGSSFSPHTHSGGEEFFVLEGVFQDEHGDYPAGTYVRNPPTSRHTPRSLPGCVIFVKLRQFDLADRREVRLTMSEQPRTAVVDLPGVSRAVLFEDARERVEYQKWESHSSSQQVFDKGAELFVLGGELHTNHGVLHAQSWLRIPPGGTLDATTQQQEATLWTKVGHLGG